MNLDFSVFLKTQLKTFSNVCVPSAPADIVFPGINSTVDVQARISAGESIHVIRGSKGTGSNNNNINMVLDIVLK